nr:MAG TPA: hypothetical protein [Caudoviricetes sp.]
MKLISLENLNYALGLISAKFTSQANTFVSALGNKVDKEDGKALSSNDFTNDAKSKLEDIDTKSAGIENIAISEEGVMTVKNIHGDEANKANIDVYAKIAHKLATPRSINGVPFDGSENIVINAGGTNDVPCTEGEILELFTTTPASNEDNSSHPSPYEPPHLS